MKSLGKIMAGAALAGTSLTGLGLMSAGGASANALPDHAVHFPGSYWKTKAECQPYSDAYVKQVKAKGNVIMVADFYGTEKDAAGCHLYDKGWSYEVDYMPAKGTATKATLIGGDFLVSETPYPAKSDMRAWRDAAGMTRWQHGDYSFDTKAKCDAAYTSVVNKIKSAGDKADLIPTVPGAISGPRSCESESKPGKWTYELEYFAAPHGNLFDYETWSSFSGDHYSEGTALPGGVYKTTYSS